MDHKTPRTYDNTYQLTTLATTLVHETIHLCVGGHLRTGHFSDTRPDAVTLAEDFLDNCWRKTHWLVGRYERQVAGRAGRRT